MRCLFFILPALSMLFFTACAPRQAVIEAGVGGTLTALVPTSVLPADRATSTAVPTLPPPTATAAEDIQPTREPTANGETSTEPPPTVEATAAAPTETPVPTAPAVGELIYEDTFDAPGLWSVGDAGDSSVDISGGEMAFTQKTPGSFSLRILGKQGNDFHLEVETALANKCTSGDRYGLLFRAQDPANYYVFQIDCDGRYRLARYVSAAGTPLIDWTDTPAIQRGSQAANTLAVTAQGSSFSLAINGEPLATASDSVFAGGRFGLTVGANITKNFTVIFDNLRVSKVS